MYKPPSYDHGKFAFNQVESTRHFHLAIVARGFYFIWSHPMIDLRRFFGTGPSLRRHSPLHWRLSLDDTRITRGHLPVPVKNVSTYSVICPRNEVIPLRVPSGTYIHEYEAGRRIFRLRPPTRGHGPGRTSWVHEELALHLICIELVRAAPQQNIHVHLPCCYQQAVCISRWDYSMAMG